MLIVSLTACEAVSRQEDGNLGNGETNSYERAEGRQIKMTAGSTEVNDKGV